jgi:hypothetical protein
MERALRTAGRIARATALLGLLATAAGLAAHTWSWRVAALAERLPQRRPVIDVHIVEPSQPAATADRVYVALVRGGFVVSLAAATALALRLRRAGQRERTADAAIPA